MQNKQHLLW